MLTDWSTCNGTRCHRRKDRSQQRFVWLALWVLELSRGERPLFSVLGTVIWAVFIVDFSVKLVLAPHRVAYLKRNWLVAISLLLPALRVFRVLRVFRLLRVARAGRGLRLVRVVSSLNRGMKALGASLSRRGFGYVITLTVLVTFGGAAGIYAFESGLPGGPASYSEALWWTAMIMTTMGSEYWPQTATQRTPTPSWLGRLNWPCSRVRSLPCAPKFVPCRSQAGWRRAMPDAAADATVPVRLVTYGTSSSQRHA